MENEAEIQARLQRMVEEDPHGKEAKQLLRYVAIFRGPFDIKALVAVARYFQEDECLNRLDVLRGWGFIHKSKYRYYLDYRATGILQPYLGAAFEHCKYYLDLKRYPRLSLIETDWTNICAALAWGLESTRDFIDARDMTWKFLLRLRAYMGQFIHHKAWHIPLEAMHTLATQLINPLEQAFTQKMLGVLAYLRMDYEGTQEAYAKTIPLYDELNIPLKKAKTFAVMGNFARLGNDLSVARKYYEQVWYLDRNDHTLTILKELATQQNDLLGLLIYLRNELHWIRSMGLNVSHQVEVFCHIGDVSQKMGNYKIAWQWHKRALQLSLREPFPGGQIKARTRLGALASLLKQHSMARDMFAQAVAMSEAADLRDSPLREDALWAWGLSEYSFSSHPSAYALCCLAILVAETRVERLHFLIDEQKPTDLYEQLKTLGCEDC